MPRLPASILLFALSLAASSLGTVHAESEKRIREVKIFREEVFTEEEAETSAWFRFLNRYHVITKETVIRTQLLFKAGDPLDMELIEQSERDLRRLDLIEVAKIDVVEVDDETVDVVVHTSDAWSVVPSIIVESGGDLTEVGFIVRDFNFLGNGKDMWIDATTTSDIGTTWSAGYDDPQLFQTRGTVSVLLKTGPLIDAVYGSLERPFYSPDTKWSYGGDAGYFDQIIRLFDAGEEISRLREENPFASLFLSRAFGPRFKRTKLEIEFGYEERLFSDLGAETTTPLPDDEEIWATTATVSLENVHFAKDTHIDKFRRVEDFRLGRNTSISLGRAGFPVSRGLERWEGEIVHSQRFKFKKKQYLFLAGALSSEETQNKIGWIAGQYYYKLDHQTIATNLELTVSDDLETSRQFEVGGDSGLRGYPARAFTGDKSFLMNLETRLFVPKLQILAIDIGSVVFLDAGRAWKRNESIDMSNLAYSAGVGVRLAFTKLPGEPITRIDFGWPLNDGGFAITFGVEQHF